MNPREFLGAMAVAPLGMRSLQPVPRIFEIVTSIELDDPTTVAWRGCRCR